MENMQSGGWPGLELITTALELEIHEKKKNPQTFSHETCGNKWKASTVPTCPVLSRAGRISLFSINIHTNAPMDELAAKDPYYVYKTSQQVLSLLSVLLLCN